MKLKILLIIAMVLSLLTSSYATITYDDDYYQRNLGNVLSGGSTDPIKLFINEVEGYLEGATAFPSLYFDPTDTIPTATEGVVYYNDTGNAFVYYNGSSWVTIGTSSGGDSLDTAYNNGHGITVDGTAVTLTVGDTANSALAIVSANATHDTDAVTITTTAAGYIGDSLYINGISGSTDIRGDNWNVNQTGAFTLVGVTTTGELLVTTSDVLFNDTYDVAWDTSEDMLIFQDNAVLGLGGDHDGAADITVTGDGTNVLIEAVSDNWGQVRIGSTNAADWAFYGSTNSNIALFDVSASEFLLNGYDIRLSDDDMITFGDSTANDSFEMDFDETTDNLLIVATTANDAVQIGLQTANTDLKLMGATASTYALWDSSADEMVFDLADLKISQGSQIEFIDVSDSLTDWTMDNANDNTLLFTCTETDETPAFHIGVDQAGADLKVFGTTAGSYFLWDASGDAVWIDKADIAFSEGDGLLFGDTLGTGDFRIDSTSAVLSITQVSDGTGSVLFSADGEGMDVTFYGDTASSQMMWDENGDTNGSLIITGGTQAITGINNGGTLLTVAGIDQGGDSDTVVVTHKGTGAGIKVTAGESDSVATNFIAAAAQTTSLAVFDGATGADWRGAANVGMLHITSDGALADVASSLVYIANSGVPQNDSRGSSLRIVDTGNAAAGTAGYAVYISATDATVEAMYIDDGNVLIDDNLEIGGTTTFSGGQTRKVFFPPKAVELDGTSAPTLTDIGTDGQCNISTLQFDADGTGTDMVCYISWIVPDGYVVDSARLNIGYSFDTAEDTADEAQFDFTVDACAAGEALDTAGTALADQTTVITDAATDEGKLHISQYTIETEAIAVDDLVTIEIAVDVDASALANSGTLDVHYFEIEYESTE